MVMLTFFVNVSVTSFTLPIKTGVISPSALRRFAAPKIRASVPSGKTIFKPFPLIFCQAKELLKDPNYFGTMLVYMKIADGMVSGAIHSTADTVRPALQIIFYYFINIF
mgnify:CR=1 FL=1